MKNKPALFWIIAATWVCMILPFMLSAITTCINNSECLAQQKEVLNFWDNVLRYTCKILLILSSMGFLLQFVLAVLCFALTIIRWIKLKRNVGRGYVIFGLLPLILILAFFGFRFDEVYLWLAFWAELLFVWIPQG